MGSIGQSASKRGKWKKWSPRGAFILDSDDGAGDNRSRMDETVFAEMLHIEDHHWWYRARRRIVREMLRAFPAPMGPVVELGCGGGGNVAMLAEFGKVVAVEMDPAGRQAAAQRGIEALDGALPDGLPFSPEPRFSRVALLDVLEHVENDQAALESIKSRLLPEGQLIITVPAHQWLWRKQDELNHHFRRYTRAGLNRLVESAGFEIKRSSYYNIGLFPLMVLVILSNKALGREQDQDNRIPGKLVNGLFEFIMGAERHVIPRVASPLGASVILVAQKPGEVTG